MVFSQYNYLKYDKSNQQQWPITDWNKMVNDNYAYCETSATPTDFIGKCDAVDLPSNHPYWKIKTLQNKVNAINKTIEKLKATANNEHLFKMEFSMLTSWNQVKKITIAEITEFKKSRYYKYIEIKIINTPE